MNLYKTGKKIIRHVYDLELKSLLENYRSGIVKVELEGTKENPEYFIDLIKYLIDEYCQAKGIEFENVSQIVVTPKDYLSYKHLLGLSLIFYDRHIIRQYLNYHEEEFKETTESNEPFIGIIEFEVVRIIRYSSPFDNSPRLNDIMKWVEDKRAEFKLLGSKENGPGEENKFIEPLLNWNEEKKLLLLGFSKELYIKGYTENPLEFQDVFFYGKVVAWKGIESWVYLMHRLTSESFEYITCERGKKPYYSIGQEYFNFCDNKDEIPKKRNLSSMSYHIRRQKIKKHQKTRQGIDSILLNILKEPLPQPQ